MEKKANNLEVCAIILTDMQLHIVEPRKPIPWYRAILRSLRSKKPARFYTKDFKVNKDGTFTATFPVPPEIKKQMEAAEKAGKKIRFILPEGGLPLYPGKDVKEYVEAQARRGLDRQRRRFRMK